RTGSGRRPARGSSRMTCFSTRKWARYRCSRMFRKIFAMISTLRGSCGTIDRATIACRFQALALLRLHKLVRRPFQRPSGLRPPEHDCLDLLGEGEIFVGDAALGVRLELHPELAPGNGEVGVVIRRLAQIADGVGEHERGGPAVGVVFAAQPAL